MIKAYKDARNFYDKANPKIYDSFYHYLSTKWNMMTEITKNASIKSYGDKEHWIAATTKCLEKQIAASKIGIAVFGTEVVQI